MKIVIDYDQGLFTVSPTDQSEHRALRSLKRELESADPFLDYCGRSTDGKGQTTVLRFERPRLGVLELTPTTEVDQDNLREIRNGVFFGGGGLLFRGSEGRGPGNLQVKFAIRQCKDCGRDLVRFKDVIWETCESCRVSCRHEWRAGRVLAGEDEDKPAQLCPKCGTGKVGDRVFTTGHITLFFHVVNG